MKAGSITFSTALDNEQLEKDLQSLTKKIEKKEREIAELTEKRDQAQGTLDSSKLEAEKATFEQMVNSQEKFGKAEEKFLLISREIEVLEQQLSEQESKRLSISESIQKTKEAILSTENELAALEAAPKGQDDVEYKKKLEELRYFLSVARPAVGNMETSLSEYDKDIQKTAASLDALREKSDKALLKIPENVSSDSDIAAQKEKVKELQSEWDQAKKSVDGYTAQLTEAENELHRQQDAAGGIVQELDKAKKESGKMKEETEKARKRMDALGKRLKEILASAFIFNVLSAGLRQFTGWLGKSIKTNEEARQSIAQLKGALLTLAQPLVEIIIPAFTLFVNILTRIITAVAQFVSSLFGKTIKQSKDGAKALYKEANAIGAVGEAADEAAGSLAGFDEINTINTENAKGAGGGGGAGDEIMPDFDFNQEGLDWLSEILGESAKWVATALLLGGIALVAIGACMGNLLLVLAGLFLLGAGITIGEETGALQSWIDALGLKNVAEFVVLAILLAGIAIVAIGAATGNIFMVLAGLVLIGTTIAYANASGMMKSWAEEQVSRAASYVTAALLLGGIALVVIGAATANILMVLAGLGLLAAGIYVGLESETLEAWAKVLGLDSVFDYVVAGIQLAGIALIAIGAAMANILMVLAGIGMLAVGTVVAATDGNLKSWVEVLELGKIMNWVTTALLLGGIALIVFGIVSGNILMILAGLGLLGAGVAVGTTSGTFQKWIDAIIKGLKDLKRDAKAWWDSNMAKFFTLEYWEGLGKDVIDGFMDGLKNAWDGLTSWFSGVWDDLFGNRKVSVGINRSGNFGSGGSGSFGGSRISASAIPPLPASKIPALARGAVIPPNREFLAVLGDQRNGTNLEAPESLIRQLFQEETGRGNAEILQLLQAILNAIKDGHVIMVGETVLGRTTIRAINNITISSGKQMLKI